jgi:hypothetical protein
MSSDTDAIVAGIEAMQATEASLKAFMKTKVAGLHHVRETTREFVDENLGEYSLPHLYT